MWKSWCSLRGASTRRASLSPPDLDGKTIAIWATACGDKAKQFCLTAPGTATLRKDDGSTIHSAGSSFAAPLVSGVAALVMEAFPWMTAGQVAQTLLGTATDLGDPGPDAVYGMGRVNADKATKGPAALSTAFDASIPEGAHATFANDLSGAGSLTKSGKGTLTVSGNTSLAGGLNVTDGTLRLLGGVDGNLTQKGGALALDAANPVSVSGSAHLENVSVGSSKWLGAEWNGTVLKAGSLDYAGSSPGKVFYDQSLRSDDGALVASLKRRIGASTGLGDGSTLQGLRGADTALASYDSGNGSGGASSIKAMTALSMLDRNAGAQAVVDSLSGQAHATARGIAMEAADIDYRWTLQRATEAGASAAGGAWAMAGAFESTIRPADAFDAQVRTTQMAAGTDRRMSDRAVAGVAVTSGRVESEFERNGGHVDSELTGGSLYGALSSGNSILTWFLAHRQLRNRVERDVLAGGGDRLHSVTKGALTSAGIRTEIPVNAHITAGAGLQHDTLRSQGFSEDGTSGFEMVAGSATASRTLAGVHLKAQGGQQAGSDGWRWDASAGYWWSLRNPDTGMNVAWKIAPGATFRLDGMKVSPYIFWTGGGLSYRHGKASLFLRGDVRHDSNGTSPGASAGVRMDF